MRLAICTVVALGLCAGAAVADEVRLANGDRLTGNELEKGKTYKLHLTSMDYNHGFSLQPANINIQIVPGFEHVVTVTPNQSGTYSVVCNEYCGIGHHKMVGGIYVK